LIQPKNDFSTLRGCAVIGHPGQVPRSGMRAGIQNNLIFRHDPGFPFDFAQGGEPVEPRVSPTIFGLPRNDSVVELRHSFTLPRSLRLLGWKANLSKFIPCGA
jgi:hypothetical protein